MNKEFMGKIELGKTYLTKHGRFVKIYSQMQNDIFNGKYEEDGINETYRLDSSRWKTDGRAWGFIFMGPGFYTPEHNIIMEDCTKAREIANQLKLERKQKAYEETN